LIACVPAIIGLSVLSKPILSIMTGEQYFEGYKIMPFVAFGALFLGLQHRFQAGFIFYRKTGYITFSIFASGLLNVMLNFIYIPKYGYFAAAITTLISYAFLLFLMVIFSRRFFVWKFPFRSLINTTSASIVMGLIIFNIGNKLTSSVLINLIFAISLGELIYFMLLFLFQEFQAGEKKAVKIAMKKYLVKNKHWS